MKIAFIGCGKQKKRIPCKAKAMYQGILFKKALQYCQQNFDQVWILSAKYGLLHLEDVIEPYDLSLMSFTKEERMEWAKKVKSQLIAREVSGDFTFFAGKLYIEYLIGNKPFEDMGGMSIGKRLQWFSKNIKRRGLVL